MENTRRLLRWANDTQGVQLNGIEPRSIPGRGIGIVASRKIKAGDVLLKVPYQAIRSLHTVPAAVAQCLPSDMSIQGLLAAELAVGMASGHPPFPAWNAVLPTSSDVRSCMPAMWPARLRRLLPAGARVRLRGQEAMFARDWAAFSAGKSFPRITRGSYGYAWLLVNSRTFYLETDRTRRYPWIDRLAQLPVADLFNHSASPSCKVSYSTRGYEVTAVDECGAGHEVSISYGDHGNDYLLIEYGFVMRPNRYDEVCLDDVILPRLGGGDDEGQKKNKEKKEEGGVMVLKPISSNPDLLEGGKKTKDDGAVFTSALASPKLQAALKTLAKGTQDSPDQVLLELIGEYLVNVEETLAEIQTMTGLDAERELLAQRWGQIKDILEEMRTTMNK